MPKGSGRLRRSRISVRVGEAITPEEIQAAMPEKGAYEAAAALVMSRIAALGPVED